MKASNTKTPQLKTPYEISDKLECLDPYVKVCFSQLLSGVKLSSMNQRKQRAITGGLWDKYINIGLAVELYKLTVLMNKKGAVDL